MFYPETSLYGIQVVGTDYIKLGLSQEPRRRMKQLQVSMPFELALVFDVLISEGRGARAFEKRLHDRLKEYCLYREWFKVDVGLCIRIVENELGVVF